MVAALSLSAQTVYSRSIHETVVHRIGEGEKLEKSDQALEDVEVAATTESPEGRVYPLLGVATEYVQIYCLLPVGICYLDVDQSLTLLEEGTQWNCAFAIRLIVNLLNSDSTSFLNFQKSFHKNFYI